MANKTRVQVRGTIGKSVKIPVAGVTQAQLAAAIAAIPASTTTTTAAAAPSSGVTSVGLSAASSDIVVVGTTPITTSGAWTVDLSVTVKTDLALAVTALQTAGSAYLVVTSTAIDLSATAKTNLGLAATAVQPGGIQIMESAGWNSTGGAIQLSLTVPQDIIIPFNCTLREVDIVTQGGTGGCTIKLWKAASLALPTSANDITGGTPPTISSGTSYTNTTLLGWTTNFSQNDRILVTLSANTVFTSVKIILRMY